MFDIIKDIWGYCLCTCLVVGFLTTLLYGGYKTIKINEIKVATAHQKVLCDCMTSQLYIESRRDGS